MSLFSKHLRTTALDSLEYSSTARDAYLLALYWQCLKLYKVYAPSFLAIIRTDFSMSNVSLRSSKRVTLVVGSNKNSFSLRFCDIAYLLCFVIVLLHICNVFHLLNL